MSTIAKPSYKCLYSVDGYAPSSQKGVPYKVELQLRSSCTYRRLQIRRIDLVKDQLFVLSSVLGTSYESLGASVLGVIADSQIVEVPCDVPMSSIKVRHFVLSHFLDSANSHITNIRDKKEYEQALSSSGL